jgi:hypothetical protein
MSNLPQGATSWVFLNNHTHIAMIDIRAPEGETLDSQFFLRKAQKTALMELGNLGVSKVSKNI